MIKRPYAVDGLSLIYENHGYFIASYYQVCPVSGEPTKDIFYTILDQNFKDADSIAYDSYDLCKLVLDNQAMGNMNKILSITSEFNSLLKQLKEEEMIDNAVYS